LLRFLQLLLHYILGGGVDGYSEAIYFIVLPAVLGPVVAVLFVVAVYICRRRHLDRRPPLTTKAAPASRVAGAPRARVTSRLTPTVTDYRNMSATSRIRRDTDVGTDEEIQVMLPCGTVSGGLFANQLPSHMPGKYNGVMVLSDGNDFIGMAANRLYYKVHCQLQKKKK